ncbi:MAG TPA: hypothetical protein VGU90_02335 [Terriglobales bacterium]|nr:hypothetical protein [Terriglobales bacterium]
MRIAAQVGSDLPLFLIGGTALGVGRGEEVYPLPDLPAMPCVIALPDTAVSTPKAFAEWDALMSESMTGKGTPSSRANHLSAANDCTIERRALSENRIPGEASKRQVPRLGNSSASGRVPSLGMTDWSKDENEKLTSPSYSDRMLEFSREISAWLSAGPSGSGRRRSGVSASRGGRAENPLLDLVRTGIENDFERVVFPQYPELRRVKSVLEQAGARYASLSGSGSALYGLFASRARAAVAAKKLTQQGTRAVVTSTLTRRQYWKKLQISD